MSEYDPLIRRADESGSDDLERVQERFDLASRAYLDSPIPWLVWAIVLPAAALATPGRLARGGIPAVVILWSLAILIGGLVEATSILRRGDRRPTPLGAWAMRVQGNQSLIGLALSAVLIWKVLPGLLPGVWLLLIGHSFFILGGLALRSMRWAGIIYQIGGLIALLPGTHALATFAVSTAAGNLLIAVALMRRRRAQRDGEARRTVDRPGPAIP